jgi:hypothetical protein
MTIVIFLLFSGKLPVTFLLLEQDCQEIIKKVSCQHDRQGDTLTGQASILT